MVDSNLSNKIELAAETSTDASHEQTPPSLAAPELAVSEVTTKPAETVTDRLNGKLYYPMPISNLGVFSMSRHPVNLYPRSGFVKCTSVASQTTNPEIKYAVGVETMIFSSNSPDQEIASSVTQPLSSVQRADPSSSGPLTEFTIFNNLPPELRFKTWKAALPTEDPNGAPRMVCIFVNDKSRPVGMVFVHNQNQWVVDDGSTTGSFELGLLKANKESRGIYLETFKHALPIPAKMLIRFDDSTTFFFPKFWELMPCLEYTMDKNVEIKMCVENIQFLKIGHSTPLYASTQSFDCHTDKLFNLIALFKNLKCLTLERLPERYTARDLVEKNVIIKIKLGLEAWKESHKWIYPTYTVPEVKLLDG